MIDRHILSLTLAFGVALAASPLSAQQCKPVVGSFEAHVVTDGCASLVGLCTAGRVWGGIQGTYSFVMTSVSQNGEPAVPTIQFFTGHSQITLKSGDQVLKAPTRAPSICRQAMVALRRSSRSTAAAGRWQTQRAKSDFVATSIRSPERPAATI